MAIRNNPSTVSSNLRFAYDVADTRTSYIGQPTTNQYANPDFTSGLASWQFASWDGGIYSYTTENILGPFGNVVPALKITRTSSSGGSADFHQGNGGKYTSGNSYTLSAYVKGSGTLIGNTQGGFSGGGVGFTLTDQWQRVSYTVASSTNSNYPFWAAAAITPNVPMYFVFAQSEQKSNVTPYVNGTRSNTQGLLDISGYSRTINLANVSFNSSAQMIFDGTDDYAEVSSFNVNENNEFTLEAIIYPNAVSTNQSIINKRTSNDFWPVFSMGLELNNLNGYYSSPVYGQSLEGVTGTSNVITAGRYHHVAFSKGTGGYTTMKLFVNGVSVPYSNFLYGSHINGIATSDKPIHIGRTFDTPNWIQPFNGLIPVSKVYNRQLTDAEILSNFNNYKKRFNL